MKKRKIIDISTEEKKKEIFEKFDEFTSKNQAHEYFGISDNKQGSEYLKQIANDVGFNLNVYKERRKNKPIRYCKECGKEITSKWGRKFCCSSCAAKYNNEHRDKSIYEKVANALRKEKNNKQKKCYNHLPKERYCIICGKKLESHQVKYCSEKCSWKGRHIKYEHVCLYCGKTFTGQKNTKFCSNTCSSEYHKSIKVKKWLSGDLKINPNRALPYSIKQYILSENEYKCQECGYEGYNRATGNSILQFHHIDGDTSNNTPENIRLLCPNCHAKTENYMALNKGKSTRNERYIKKRNGGAV